MQRAPTSTRPERTPFSESGVSGAEAGHSQLERVVAGGEASSLPVDGVVLEASEMESTATARVELSEAQGDISLQRVETLSGRV